ncbi:MAG: tyrosine-type recombinase/integrase [Planctomycetaceae bacterium]
MPRSKPAKPYRDFPLFPHGSGQWAKKIRGKTWYFGSWDDPDTALKQFLAERDHIQAGENPRLLTGSSTPGGHTVRDVCNHFLTVQRQKVDSGELSPRTFADYMKTCERVIGFFGKETVAATLKPSNFSAFRQSFPSTWGPRMAGREIRQTKTLFRFAAEEELVDHLPNFGGNFKQPGVKVLRRLRQEKRNAHGELMFEAAELRSMVAQARRPWDAMILLGANCAFGNSDIANLPRNVIDLAGGWIDYGRQKTGIDRRCPLWPETIAALRDSLLHRRLPVDSGDSELVFLTTYRNRYIRETSPGKFSDGISGAFSKMLERWGVKRPGLGFYSLRRTFETVAAETGDQITVDHIMGHIDQSMAGVYRQRIADAQLLRVSEHVRLWFNHNQENALAK